MAVRPVASCAGLVLAGSVASSAAAAFLSGSVVDETGASPPSAYVLAFRVGDMASLGMAETVGGRYNLMVPDAADTLLVAIPFSGREVEGYAVHEFTAGLEVIRSPSEVVERDIGVLRCHEVVLEGRHPDGSLMVEGDFPAGSYAVDGSGEAPAEVLLAVSQGASSAAVPALCIPLGEERRLYVRRELEGAGRLDLPVDRDGSLFTATSQGAEVLDLNRATATSQLARLDELMSRLAGTGEALPAAFITRRQTLDVAAVAASVLAGGAAAQAWDAVAADAVITLEDLVLWAADLTAQRCRSGSLALSVVGDDGWPAAGVEIAFEQVSHDFVFGIFEPLATAGAAGYERLRQAGLNTVTAGFYWRDIEPDQGQVRWDYIDHEIGVRDLAAAGWRMKGHPLTWLLDLAMPAYLSDLGAEELTRVSVEHITEVVSRYSDDVRVWDVNNEASGYAASGGLSRSEMDDYLLAVFAAARAADPSATLILNNHFDRFGRARLQERLEGRPELYTLSVKAFVQRALAAGVDLDVIGQQMYNGGAVTFFADFGLGPVASIPTYDLAFLAETLDELAELGKPVHVTEQSVSSEWSQQWSDAGAGYWRRPWDEQAQADFVEAFYRLCFGTPAVRAVTWWNAVDDSAFVVGGGLLRPDRTAKPALERLEALIQGWTSRGTLVTAPSGAAELRGFAGDYDLVVRGPGWEQSFTAHVTEGQAGGVTLVLDRPMAPGPRRASGRVE